MTSERGIRDYARDELFFDRRRATPRLVAQYYATSHQPGAQSDANVPHYPQCPYHPPLCLYVNKMRRMGEKLLHVQGRPGPFSFLQARILLYYPRNPGGSRYSILKAEISKKIGEKKDLCSPGCDVRFF